MKSSVIIFALFIVFGLVMGGLSLLVIPPVVTQAEPESKGKSLRELVAVHTPDPIPTAGVPLQIRIPALDLETEIEMVAKDSQGRMDVPKDVYQAGWYEPGARPGETGQAVIDGHINTPSLQPSIFYNLHKLEKDDRIFITDSKDTQWEFKVNSVVVYDNSDFPIQTVFGNKPGRHLNLITCSGSWDSIASEFTQRTVVFSSLENYQTQQ